MKCIILAAGLGKRIKNVTKKQPKCLIKINNETLLSRQIRLFRSLNIKKITVIRGFKADKISFNFVKYVFNKNFKTNEQLDSLICAKKEFNQDILVTFADIIYDLSIVKKISKSTLGDIVLGVDRNWKERYKFRYDHPFNQADKVKVDKEFNITNIGKKISLDDTNAEFLGIFKLTKKGCKLFLKNYFKIKKEKKTNKMQIHNFIQYMINNNNEIKACFINGRFMEIDTQNDLKIAKKIFNNR